MNEILETLKAQLAALNALKTGERSESQRRLAIFATTLEQALAFGTYAASEG